MNENSVDRCQLGKTLKHWCIGIKFNIIYIVSNILLRLKMAFNAPKCLGPVNVPGKHCSA